MIRETTENEPTDQILWKAHIDQTFKSLTQLALFPGVRSLRIVFGEKSVSTGEIERPGRVHWTCHSLSLPDFPMWCLRCFQPSASSSCSQGRCQFFREVLFTPQCGQHLFPLPSHRAHPQNSIHLSDRRYAFDTHCAHQPESSVGRGPAWPVSSV